MKIVLVNPNNRIQSRFAGIEPPLWAGLIAAHHLHVGREVSVIDAEALNLTPLETIVSIHRERPDKVIIVVMGNNPSVSSTPKMPISELLASQLSQYDVSLAGLHPNAAGSRYNIIKQPFIGMPDMPWELLDMGLYRAHNWHCLDGSPRSPYASVYSSQGCPFQCYFCNIHALYGDRNIRWRPIKNMLKEIHLLASRYKVKNIKFWDELFALKEERVFEICEGLPKGLNIWAYARVDTVTPRMLKAMKQGGMNWLAYGFESADAKIRDGVNKHSDVERAIDMTRDAGINIMANFMFGLPGETLETMRATLDFAKSHLFEYVNFYDALPYPGSPWYRDNPSKDWAKFDQYGRTETFRDKAFREYITYGPYLDMLCEKFGDQAMKELQEIAWTGKPLSLSSMK